MRKLLYEYSVKNNITLLHCDMFPYKANNIIDLSIQEENMINVASGIAYTKNPVFIYGVCGFVLYKGLEQIIYSLLEFGSKFAPVIFFNAGANGCYKNFGKGHEVKYDKEICDMLKIPLYEPNYNDFNELISELLKSNGLKFVRLGKDI